MIWNINKIKVPTSKYDELIKNMYWKKKYYRQLEYNTADDDALNYILDNYRNLTSL